MGGVADGLVNAGSQTIRNLVVVSKAAVSHSSGSLPKETGVGSGTRNSLGAAWVPRLLGGDPLESESCAVHAVSAVGTPFSHVESLRKDLVVKQGSRLQAIGSMRFSVRDPISRGGEVLHIFPFLAVQLAAVRPAAHLAARHPARSPLKSDLRGECKPPGLWPDVGS